MQYCHGNPVQAALAICIAIGMAGGGNGYAGDAACTIQTLRRSNNLRNCSMTSYARTENTLCQSMHTMPEVACSDRGNKLSVDPFAVFKLFDENIWSTHVNRISLRVTDCGYQASRLMSTALHLFMWLVTTIHRNMAPKGLWSPSQEMTAGDI